MKKIIRAIYNRIYAYIILLKNIKGTEAKILSANETVKKVLKDRKSLIRLGDGEFAFLQGHGIFYQKYDKRIKEEFLKIIDEYNNESNYILCVPKFYFECYGTKIMKKISLTLAWAKPREYFNKNFNLNHIYGDAFLFAKGNKEIYDNIFKKSNIEKVIFIHNDNKYAEIFAKEYSKIVKFIKVPPKDAFDNLEEVYNKVLEMINEKINE